MNVYEGILNISRYIQQSSPSAHAPRPLHRLSPLSPSPSSPLPQRLENYKHTIRIENYRHAVANVRKQTTSGA